MMTRRTFNFTCRQGASTGTFLTKKSIVCEMTSVVTQAIVNLYRTATVIVKSANLRKQNNKVKELCWYTQYRTVTEQISSVLNTYLEIFLY
jgi:hypothetical protein